MLKKIYAILFFSAIVFAQAQNSGIQSDNAFNKSEKGVEASTAKQGNQGPIGNDAGNPGDPLPIDQFVPVLSIIGLGIIIAANYRRKTN